MKSVSGVIKEETARLDEMGLTGLQHWSGTIDEEFLRTMKGRLGRETLREMSNNDAVIGSMLYAIEMFLRPVEWKVEPYDDSKRAEKDADFVRECYNDMSHSWEEFISEWMSAVVYGYAPFEIVWKIRNGYSPDKDRNSKYTDRKFGIAKLAIRHPDTLDRWEYEEGSDKLLAMHQRPAHSTKAIRIPTSKLMIFTMLKRKGSPEGTSLLRRAYVAWYRKKKVEEIETIGIERELAGLPLFKTPAQWWQDDATSNQKALLDEVKEMGRRIRADEQACVVIPSVYDAEGNELLTFELVSTGGARAIDTGPSKEYYSRQIAMSVLMDVFLMGHEKSGSFALSDSKTNLFSTGLGSMLGGIQDVHNQTLIPSLLRVNGRDPSRPPKLVHGDLETPDLGAVGEYVSKIAGANFQLFPTDTGDLERKLLEIANLPEEAADEIITRMKKEKKQKDAAAKASRELAVQSQEDSRLAVDRGNAGAGPPGAPQDRGAGREQDRASGSTLP